MKNNKGWGTMEMLLLSCGLLLALLIAIFFINRLFGSLDYAVGNKSYANMEINLESAARRYVEDNNITVDNTYRINAQTLIAANYISSLVDSNNNPCSGYVLVSNSTTYLYKGYISCNNYQTRNYEF